MIKTGGLKSRWTVPLSTLLLYPLNKIAQSIVLYRLESVLMWKGKFNCISVEQNKTSEKQIYKQFTVTLIQMILQK